jgi:hypothetical protein
MSDMTGEERKVCKIEKVEKLDTARQVETELVEAKEEVTFSKTKFDDALAKAEVNFDRNAKAAQVVQETKAAERLSPIAELGMSSKKIQRLGPATTESIIAQAEQVQSTLQIPKNKIEETLKADTQVKISPVHEAQLSEKLVHMDSTLKSALGIVGAEVPTKPVAPTHENHPLVKFLNYLTHGDKQMNSIVGELQGLNVANEPLTAGKLLAVQIKLGFVQQELEFFTNVLNKALESTKTIMNVQV